MNTKQYKNVMLVRLVMSCLKQAQTAMMVQPDMVPAELSRALAYARQLPSIPKYRAIRAHIVTAQEALSCLN